MGLQSGGATAVHAFFVPFLLSLTKVNKFAAILFVSRASLAETTTHNPNLANTEFYRIDMATYAKNPGLVLNLGSASGAVGRSLGLRLDLEISSV